MHMLGPAKVSTTRHSPQQFTWLLRSLPRLHRASTPIQTLSAARTELTDLWRQLLSNSVEVLSSRGMSRAEGLDERKEGGKLYQIDTEEQRQEQPVQALLTAEQGHAMGGRSTSIAWMGLGEGGILEWSHQDVECEGRASVYGSLRFSTGSQVRPPLAHGSAGSAVCWRGRSSL